MADSTADSKHKHEPREIKGIRLYHIKLPKNPRTEASFLLIQLLNRNALTIQESDENANSLCDILALTIERPELVELAKELTRRFPESKK